jgi:hypothetical protein
MKTKEQIELIFEEYKKKINNVNERIAELDAWIEASIATKNESLIVSVFKEKQEQLEKKRIGEAQIRIVEYILK